jgi:hypothetical protein
METMAKAIETGNAADVQQRLQDWWAGVDVSAIPVSELPGVIDKGFAGVLGKPDLHLLSQATQLLWDLHHPYMVWVYLGIFGVVGTIGMIVFYLVTKGTKHTAPVEKT